MTLVLVDAPPPRRDNNCILSISSVIESSALLGFPLTGMDCGFPSFREHTILHIQSFINRIIGSRSSAIELKFQVYKSRLDVG